MKKRNRKRKKCILCDSPAVTKNHCQACRERVNADARERMRKRRNSIKTPDGSDARRLPRIVISMTPEKLELLRIKSQPLTPKEFIEKMIREQL